ncbi:hypothetical protein [Cupriavidus basilensis]|uniref:hypothetical protein n=1 Tax=Cupriavidus basilensis TaxID=68895 RepID=UPI0011471164|nr:hypothetical protein [Cupriavidus basilensis]
MREQFGGQMKNPGRIGADYSCVRADGRPAAITGLAVVNIAFAGPEGGVSVWRFKKEMVIVSTRFAGLYAKYIQNVNNIDIQATSETNL